MNIEEAINLMKEAMSQFNEIEESFENNPQVLALAQKLEEETITEAEATQEYEKLYQEAIRPILQPFDQETIKLLLSSINGEFIEKNHIPLSSLGPNQFENMLFLFFKQVKNDPSFIDGLIENEQFTTAIEYSSFVLGTLLSSSTNEKIVLDFLNQFSLNFSSTETANSIRDERFSSVCLSVLTSLNFSSSFKEQILTDDYFLNLIGDYYIGEALASSTISRDVRKRLVNLEKISHKITGVDLGKIMASLCDTKEELENILFDERYYNNLEFSTILGESSIAPNDILDLLLDERIIRKISGLGLVHLIPKLKISSEEKLNLILNPAVLKKLSSANLGELISLLASNNGLIESLIENEQVFQKMFNTSYDSSNASLFPFFNPNRPIALSTKKKLLENSRLVPFLNRGNIRLILSDRNLPLDLKNEVLLNQEIFSHIMKDVSGPYGNTGEGKEPSKYDKFDYLMRLYQRNPYIANTIDFGLFKDEILDCGFELVERLSKYPNMVSELSSLALHGGMPIFHNMIHTIENSDYANELNINLFITKVVTLLNSLFDESKEFPKVINHLDIQNLTPEEWKVLTQIGLKDMTSYYQGIKDSKKIPIDLSLNISVSIESNADLDTYEERRLKKCDEILLEAVREKDLEKAKNAYFNKYLNINIQEAKEILRMFGHSISQFENGENELIVQYLRTIEMILSISKIATIEESYWAGATPLTFDETVYLEQGIRKLFSRDLSNSVLKLFDDNGKEINPPITYVSYECEINNQKVIKRLPVYSSGLNFKMLIHSTAAYGEMTLINNNYFDSWNLSERKSNHGICCSLIANNNMGMAAVNDVLFGFDSWAPQALQKSSPYDIYTSNDDFDIEEGRPLTYMSAQDIIDNTRHTHNEQTIEREELRKDRANLEYPNIQPSYVIIYSDMTDEIKAKAYKCSAEMNIPIVYIDKEAIVANEVQKMDALINNFRATSDFSEKLKLLESILLSHENNRSGLRATNPTWLEQYFPTDKVKSVITSMIIEIQDQLKQDNDYIEYYKKVTALLKILETEAEKFDITMEAVARKNFIDIPIEEYKTILLRIINPNACRVSTPKLERIIANSEMEESDMTIHQVLQSLDRATLHASISALESQHLYQEETRNHNIGHIERVIAFSQMIAATQLLDSATGKVNPRDYLLLMECAKYHDCGRQSDTVDKKHAERSAQKVEELLSGKYSLTDIALMKVVIEYHDMVDDEAKFERLCEKYNLPTSMRETAHKIAICLKDADALDRVRFKNAARLDNSLLRTQRAKELMPIAEQLLQKYREYDENEFKRNIRQLIDSQSQQMDAQKVIQEPQGGYKK